MVGSIIGWTLLALLALLILALVLPIVFLVEYRNEAFTLKAWALGVPFTLFPPPQKKEKQAEEESPKEKKKKAKRDMQEWADLIKQIASSADAGLRFLFRRMRIRHVELVYPVRGEDAAETAMNYGIAQSVLGATRALLDNFFNIRYKRLQIIPDFGEQYGDKDVVFSCKILASPAIIILTAIVALHKFATFNDLLRRTLFGKTTKRRPNSAPPQNTTRSARPNSAPINKKPPDEQRSV